MLFDFELFLAVFGRFIRNFTRFISLEFSRSRGNLGRERDIYYVSCVFGISTSHLRCFEIAHGETPSPSSCSFISLKAIASYCVILHHQVC